MKYRVLVTPTARRRIDRLPGKVPAAILATVTETIAEEPYRSGRSLSFELSGLLAARRGEYRIVYRVNEGTGTVEVLRAEHRRGVYRPRS